MLEAAEKWGVPPWVVTGEAEPKRFKWYARWSSYTDAINQGKAAAQEKATRDSKRKRR